MQEKNVVVVCAILLRGSGLSTVSFLACLFDFIPYLMSLYGCLISFSSEY